MRPRSLLLTAAVWVSSAGLLPAQYEPPASKPPDAAVLKAIAAKKEKLESTVALLRKQLLRDPGLAEVDIFIKAATWIVRHNEFYQPNYGEWTLEMLDRGLLRASQLQSGQMGPWLQQSGVEILRAYRSRVDGSVQPYAVTLPADYGKNPKKKYRLDIVLHGRDPSLTEVKFLYQHGAFKAAPKDQDFIRIDIFGRGNNAYRWAGETDVFEAVDNFITVERFFGRDRLIDGSADIDGRLLSPNRVVLRGFSMGGAGSWHIGLHYPDRWCVIGPGAGFTVTHGYIKGLPEKLPPYQEACLHIYDAADYAENAFNVPVVAYSGADDPQMDAARQIENRLKALGIKMTHLVAPGLGHSFPAEWQQKAEAEYARYAGKGRAEYPPKVRFVTYTLRYPSCSWVEVLALEKHYEKTLVEAEKTDTGFTVKTANVRGLRLTLADVVALPQVVKIDGEVMNVRPYRNSAGLVTISLDRRDGRWHGVLPQKQYVDHLRQPRKAAALQGPIDDAFMDGFLCVRGTGKPWHEATQKYAEKNLQRFQAEWNQFMRGDLPIKDDVDVTEEDINGKHLILFGDPASNSLIAGVVDGLPLKWTKESITLAGKTYAAAEHVPALIYPSPLNTNRYVVLNSGHTFHAADFRGTNALLYPRLGDYAILKPAPSDKDPAAATVIAAGLFDDSWQAK
jgi:dienelactone hydrolase